MLLKKVNNLKNRALLISKRWLLSSSELENSPNLVSLSQEGGRGMLYGCAARFSRLSDLVSRIHTCFQSFRPKWLIIFSSDYKTAQKLYSLAPYILHSICRGVALAPLRGGGGEGEDSSIPL